MSIEAPARFDRATSSTTPTTTLQRRCLYESTAVPATAGSITGHLPRALFEIHLRMICAASTRKTSH